MFMAFTISCTVSHIQIQTGVGKRTFAVRTLDLKVPMLSGVFFVYLYSYTTAISEMTIHNACGGAVQILSDENSTQTQVGRDVTAIFSAIVAT